MGFLCVCIFALVKEDRKELPRNAGKPPQSTASHLAKIFKWMIGKPCTVSSNGHQSSEVGRQEEDDGGDMQKEVENERRG